MNTDTPLAARIAFRLPQSLYDQLKQWAETDDRPLSNLVYTLVKQAVIEHERGPRPVDANKETHP